MTPLSREILEQIRRENAEARRAADPAEIPDVRKGKRSTAKPRLKSTDVLDVEREPVTLTLRWAVLLPDNHRLLPIVRYEKGKPKAMLITSGVYREAKAEATEEIKFQWRGFPFQGPVRLRAEAWFPDERKRDCGNYRKLITDALTGIAYDDDAQLHDERWVRCGIDRTNPRIEIHLESMTTKHGAAA